MDICMTKSTSEKIIEKIQQAYEFYHRLIIVVGQSGVGKTATLREIHQERSIPLINVGLMLSRQMLELTEKQRTIQAARLLEHLVADTGEDTVLLDNIEILFDTALKLNPLNMLRKISRDKTVVVSWNGMVEDGYLTYAVPDHPEYRRDKIEDTIIVMLINDEGPI